MAKQTVLTQTASDRRAERYEQGIRLRRKTPRQKHADLLGPSDRYPVAILAAGDRTRVPELLGSIQVVARKLLDKLDDASPHAWLLYPHERLGEREPVARGEEFGHTGGRRRR